MTGGQRLPSEIQLSSDFGVSRPVVRETISRLQAGGLVTTRHGSGAFVVGQPKEPSIKLAPIASASALGLCFELRTALECEAAILAARRWAGPCIAAIEAATAEPDQDDDCDSWSIASDHHFHLAVARASQSAVLEDALTALLAHISGGIGFAPNASSSLGRQARELDWREHQAIEAAIRERDEGQAYAAMRHHLESARLRLLDGSIGP